MVICTYAKKISLWTTALCTIAVLLLLSGCPTAHKQSPSSFTVTFEASAHGSLTAELNGKEFKSGDKAPQNSVIIFSATPNNEYKVAKWIGASEDASDKKKASLTVTKDEKVSVTFGVNANLTELRLPGTGKADPPGFDFQYSQHGQTVELTVKGRGFNLGAFSVDNLTVTVKDASGAAKGTVGTKTKKSDTEIAVQYTFPAASDVSKLETLTAEAELSGKVMKERFLPAAIEGTELIRWDKDSPVTDVKIPTYITAISRHSTPVGAFSKCANITSVTVPNSVTAINDNSFVGCTGLKSIQIPDSVTTLGHSAFNGCTELTGIKLPSAITKIENYTFHNCSKLKNLQIPENVTLIGQDAFNGCTSITNIVIPNKVTKIELQAFSGCTGLEKVIIGTKVTDITQSSFSGCSNLADIVINSAEVATIGNEAFKDIKHGAHFTVKTEEIKTLIKNSHSGITDDQIEVKP